MPLTDATSPQPKRSRRNNPSNRANHRLLLQQPASVAQASRHSPIERVSSLRRRPSAEQLASTKTFACLRRTILQNPTCWQLDSRSKEGTRTQKWRAADAASFQTKFCRNAQGNFGAERVWPFQFPPSKQDRRGQGEQSWHVVYCRLR